MTVQTNSYPEVSDHDTGVVSGRTQGGKRVRQKKGAGGNTKALHLVGISDSEAAALKSFYQDTCVGSMYDFTFTDAYGTVYDSVLWLNPTWGFQKDFHNSWSGAIDIEIL